MGQQDSWLFLHMGLWRCGRPARPLNESQTDLKSLRCLTLFNRFQDFSDDFRIQTGRHANTQRITCPAEAMVAAAAAASRELSFVPICFFGIHCTQLLSKWMAFPKNIWHIDFKPMVTGKHRNICNLHITFNLPASHTHVKNRRTPLHDWKILKVYLRGTHITGGKVRKGQNRASLLWTPLSCRDYRQRYNPISSAFPTVPSHESLSPAAR